jgi:hypothetical protein
MVAIDESSMESPLLGWFAVCMGSDRAEYLHQTIGRTVEEVYVTRRLEIALMV